MQLYTEGSQDRDRVINQHQKAGGLMDVQLKTQLTKGQRKFINRSVVDRSAVGSSVVHNLSAAAQR